MRSIVAVTANEIRVGDTILSRADGDEYPYPLTVGRITDHMRGGVRLGPRFYSTTPRMVGRLDARNETVFVVERPDPDPEPA